jgi:uncharacterized protein
MKNQKKRRKLHSILWWILWVVLAQVILINISAALYADKLTHLQFDANEALQKPPSQNIFSKTWRLFTGPTLYKRVLTSTPAFPYSTILLKTKNDLPIEAWYSKADSGSKGTVILIHGLTGNKGMVVNEGNAFRSMGYHVLLVDLRSHGNSGGTATTMGYKESEEVMLAYEHIKQTGEKNIFIWGMSMGAVAVMKAVADHQLQTAGIIVEMPFLSLQSHTAGRARSLGFPGQPFAFLTSFWTGIEHGFNGIGFRTTKYAKKINCPVLMQYGKNDELVLQYETNAIYRNVASPNKKLVIYDYAGHESFLQNDPVTWKREVAAFLK